MGLCSFATLKNMGVVCVMILSVTAVPRGTLAASLHGRNEATEPTVSAEPAPEQFTTVRLRPDVLITHLRSHWMSHGFWSEEIRELLAPEFLQSDRPLLISFDPQGGESFTIGFTAKANAPRPSWLKPRSCRVSPAGVTWCTTRATLPALDQLDAAYLRNGSSAALDAELPDALFDAISHVIPWRDDIPRQTSALLAKFGGTNSGALASVLDGWMYDLHGQLLETARNTREVAISLTLDADGAVVTRGTIALVSDSPLQAALQQVPQRVEYPILRRFPEDTDFAFATSAKLIGALSTPTPRLARAIVRLKEPLSGTTDLGQSFSDFREQCFMRDADLAIGWGHVRDFQIRQSDPVPDGADIDAGQYLAVGIVDRSAACYRATKALSTILGVPPTQGGELGEQLGIGNLAVRRIGEQIWFVQATSQQGQGLVFNGLATTKARLPPQQSKGEPAAVVVRTRRTPIVLGQLIPVRQDSQTSIIRFHQKDDHLTVMGTGPESLFRKTIATIAMGAVTNEKILANAERMTVACVLGSNDACNGAGVAYLDWVGVQDLRKAISLFKKGCDAEHGMACTNLGLARLKDAPTEARVALNRGCDLGAVLGCAALGRLLLESTNSKDQKAATRSLRMACDHRNPAACANLGYQYVMGKGVPADHDEGAKHYAMSCDLSYGLGCVLLANLCYEGKSITRDLKKAYTFYEKACNLDNLVGCYSVGLMKYRGEGVEQDIEGAKRLWGKACDKGHADSCLALADMKGTKS